MSDEQPLLAFQFTHAATATSTLTFDEARRTFGLSDGTPDDELPGVVNALLAAFPHRYGQLLVQGELISEWRSDRFSDFRISDEDGMQLYPEP